MNTAVLLLFLIDFSMIGLLPILFFKRDGDFSLRWILTALPFFLAVLVLLLGWLDVLQAWLPAGSRRWTAMQVLSVPFGAASIGLIGMTVGTHRIPLALWHQENDAPAEIVTWGPYAWVRHPFYTSFLLGFIGIVLVMPHWSTLGLVIYALVSLTLTASREERRLSRSELGDSYRQYMAKTGRVWPTLSGPCS